MAEPPSRASTGGTKLSRPIRVAKSRLGSKGGYWPSINSTSTLTVIVSSTSPSRTQPPQSSAELPVLRAKPASASTTDSRLSSAMASIGY